ncbi:Ig-like domain-containing protein [Terracoccus sp. 273MFTsu3.1]|uniref:Ig-like domain-containing protein n=1 Tax=Terracoccus sp. 273MFTsu3.1 TaxID=1172188 RepID=UPI0012DF6EE3|nr:Ig-like domain-containing protein [Terracoccus sp. 273MFTsu3.1]
MPAPTPPKTRARRAAPSRGVRALRVTVLMAVLMTVSGTAWASWTVSGRGTGTAPTATLSAPSSVTATAAAGATTVSVAWTPPSAGVAPTGYRVDRTDVTTSATVAACGTSPSTLLTTTSCNDPSVPDGTFRYTVVAVRSGWTATSPSSASVTVQASVATSTSVRSSANPSVVGQPVTYTATVSAVSGTPTGSVTFRDGGSALTCAGGSQTLSAGTATCTVAPASAGTRSITAAYAGSAPYAGSSSAAVSQVVNAAATTTSVTSSTNPSVVGQSVTFTATVSASAPGGGTPGGTVTFKDGATTLTCTGGTPTLTSGSTTCVVSLVSAGTRSITAVYSGSADHLTSTSPTVSQVVGAAVTTTTLTTSAQTVRTGQSVTYTATVAATAPGGGVPTGGVTFKDGSTVITCASGSQTLSAAGVATCTTTFATAGSRSVTAAYVGTANHSASTSAPLSQGVVNGGAVGLVFSGVTVNGTAVTPSCTGTVGSSYTCTVAGGNNAVVAANVAFGSSTQTPVSYSGATESIGWTSTGKSAGSGTVTVAPNATTSTATVTATKNGVNAASVTVTFTESGGSTWTAVLTVS